MYPLVNYYASSQIITVPLEPPGRVIANLYAYPEESAKDEHVIVTGDIFCACCGEFIPYVCIGVGYDGVINLYEADYRGHFRIALPINIACMEITFSHPCFREYKILYSVRRSRCRELNICLCPKKSWGK